MTYIALIDYEMGNLQSVTKALEYVGAELRTVRTVAEAENASALVLPGVGNFGDGIKHLSEKKFLDFIRDWTTHNRPFLGICLGMQMLLDSSEEAPGVSGLQIFRGAVRRFPENTLKVPHIGWNTLTLSTSAPMFAGLPLAPFFYFVHSYYVTPENPKLSAATTDYILPFTSAICHGNVWATQFHPEKSQENGLTILRNFVHMTQNPIS
ncbi:MAG: imidazole glycerol phosphate synthase subunit HisH [Planctomycetia bacterium]|nr:imidazole glycerol phosphate synthase subunit HisH [Planctomycetia bacterium]